MTYGSLNRLAYEMERVVGEEAMRTGTVLRWTPAIRCSCYGEDGQPRNNCLLCQGFGWFWRPEDEKKVRGILTSIASHRDLAMSGFFQRDDLVFTPVRKLQTGINDRFRVDRADLFHVRLPAEAHIVQRKDNTVTDLLPHRIARMRNIAYVNWRTGENIVYKQGRDYAITENGITWLKLTSTPPAGAQVPPQGNNYSVNYDADYDMVVVEPPTPRGFNEVSVAARVVLRKHQYDAREATRPGSINYFATNY